MNGNWRARVCGLLAAFAPWACSQPDPAPIVQAVYRFEVPDLPGDTWFKGNTHAHTDESDGDSPPEAVARWYKDHNYNFLVLTDHNVRVDPDRFQHLQDSTFLLIPGEEVTSSFDDAPVHVNALNSSRLIEPRVDSTLVGTIQKNVDAIRYAEAAPHINHPNFQWAFGFEELIQVRGDRLLEIWSGHPLVHNEGVLTEPSVEFMWDQLLSSGKVVYGIAVDDAHHFQGEFGADRVNPGRGWVSVRAAALEADQIVESLENGYFYASNGVELEDIQIDSTRIRIQIRQEADYRYFTYFLGSDGRQLGGAEGTSPEFFLNASTRYVRARVQDSGGRRAWTQPVFVTVEARSDTPHTARFLALGDSYTIGESVEPEDRWGHQLVRRLVADGVDVGLPEIVARTGWTTDELDEAIGQSDVSGRYDLVTLLIGVNNQYRGRDAVEYHDQFVTLLDKAVEYAGEDTQHVVVISIPDWGVTPTGDGRDRARIAAEIDVFNELARRATLRRGARWVDITDLSRLAADNPSMTADDGLHPTAQMYELWVERLLPSVEEILKDVP